jgi:hypothetical protein
MTAYQKEVHLTILSLDHVELLIDPEKYGIDTDEQHHLIGGEFFYCGLPVDGKMLLSGHELNILLPLLDAQVHHVSGNILHVNCKADPMGFHVRHITTENIEDDEEDDVMIFVIKPRLNEMWADPVTTRSPEVS